MDKKNSPQSLNAVLSQMTVYQLWGWVLLVWSLYRYFFRGTPEWMDEFLIKPIVFFVPVVWYVFKKEKRRWDSLGITKKNLFMSVYIGLGFGFLFALEGIAANAIKYGKLQITPIQAFEDYGFWLLIISVATAVWEEVLNRGFLFNRIYEQTNKLLSSAFISTLCFVFLHVPILVTALHFSGPTLIIFFATTFILGFANALLFVHTGSLVAPILVHVFWNMTVALYL